MKEENVDALEHRSQEYSEVTLGANTRGIIGALDGLAVQIKRPTSSDGVNDPGNYYSRKQFYALNVQAICDAYKRFLWVSTGHQGSTHDSLAFSSTQLFDLLVEKEEFLETNGYYLIGDLAYNLCSWMLVPYSNVGTVYGNRADTFNYFLSSSRVRIECAFGELVMRWGIFWRPIRFRLETTSQIIKAAMLLHNYLIQERMQCWSVNIDENEFFQDFSVNTMIELADMVTDDLEFLVVDNGEPKPRGRPTYTTVASRDKGIAIRDQIAVSLRMNDLIRPTPIDRAMGRNPYGHLYYKQPYGK